MPTLIKKAAGMQVTYPVGTDFDDIPDHDLTHFRNPAIWDVLPASFPDDPFGDVLPAEVTALIEARLGEAADEYDTPEEVAAALGRLEVAGVFYVADATGVAATDVAAIQAALDAAGAAGGGKVLLSGNAAYNIGATSLTFPVSDNVVLEGPVATKAVITYTGNGAAVKNGTPASIRRRCGIRRVRLNCQGAGAGARGIEVENFYRGYFQDVLVDLLGVAGTGVKFIGAADRSTYYNVFDNCDIIANTFCVDLGNQCNGNRFIGGTLEGTGIAVNIAPTAQTCDTCKFQAVIMQTSGATTIQLGGGGAGSSDHQFTDCRLETFTAAAVVIGALALRNTFTGGSASGGITFTRGDASNAIWIPEAGLVALPLLSWPFPQTTDYRYIVGGANPAANRCIYQRARGSGTITKIAFDVGVSSGNVDVGVYANNGAFGRSARPGTRRGSSGSVPCPAAGVGEATLTGTVHVWEGDWLAIATDNATATFQHTGANGSTTNQCAGLSHFQTGTFPLPSTAGPSGTNAAYAYVLTGVA